MKEEDMQRTRGAYDAWCILSSERRPVSKARRTERIFVIRFGWKEGQDPWSAGLRDA